MNTPTTWTCVTVRDGPTSLDWDRRVITLRKPRSLPEGAIPSPYDSYVTQFKQDGERVVVALRPDVGVWAFTSRPTDLAAAYPDHPLWKRITEALLMVAIDLDAPMSSVFVDAELHVPGEGREAVKTALANGDPRLELACFACGWLPDHASISDVNNELELRGLRGLGYYDGVVSLGYLDRLGLLTSEDKASIDGLVYKQSMYGEWWKVKHRLTVDCFVTKVCLGVGKYWGMCGALEVAVRESDGVGGVNVRVIARVSGMDDETRRAIRVGADSPVIGHVCEVAYERLGSAGRLQHPRFIRWRDDKRAVDCTEDQL